MIAVGNDYRDYSLSDQERADTLGLMQAGIQVKDIGPALSARWRISAQFHLGRTGRGNGHRLATIRTAGPV